jgi:hypothetical protein
LLSLKKNLGTSEQQRIRLNPDFRKHILAQAMELKAMDIGFEEFAAAMGVAPRSLYYWQKRASSRGFPKVTASQ